MELYRLRLFAVLMEVLVWPPDKLQLESKFLDIFVSFWPDHLERFELLEELMRSWNRKNLYNCQKGHKRLKEEKKPIIGTWHQSPNLQISERLKPSSTLVKLFQLSCVALSRHHLDGFWLFCLPKARCVSRCSGHFSACQKSKNSRTGSGQRVERLNCNSEWRRPRRAREKLT